MTATSLDPNGTSTPQPLPSSDDLLADLGDPLGLDSRTTGGVVRPDAGTILGRLATAPLPAASHDGDDDDLDDLDEDDDDDDFDDLEDDDDFDDLEDDDEDDDLDDDFDDDDDLEDDDFEDDDLEDDSDE